jgi:hypothetical protein
MHFVCGEMQGNPEAARRRYAERFPNRRLPNRRNFQSVHRLLRGHGTFRPQRVNAGRQRHRRTTGLEERIPHTIEVPLNISTRSTASTVGISHMSVWRTLRGQLLNPYHFQRVQALLPADASLRQHFCQWLLRQFASAPLFITCVLFTDEACFTRSGILNVHSAHAWADENPGQTRNMSHQHQFSINVWAGVVGDHFLGPHALPARLTNNDYLQFLREELPVMLEDVLYH